MIRHLFARLFPPRGRHARAPREAVSFRMDNTDATWSWLRPDADPAAPTVLLPAVLHEGAGHVPAGDVSSVHVGATEDYGRELHEATERDRYIERLADECGIDVLDPVTRPFLEDAADFHEAGDRALVELAAGWAVVERGLSLILGGPVEYRAFVGPLPDPKPVKAADFGDALTLAGVIVLPARAVDYSTAEYPAVLV